MDAAVLYKTADLLLKFLWSPICKEIQSIWKYEEEIQTITHTIRLVGDVLSDIESKQFHEESVISGYRRLREAFLDAEDFLDKVETYKKKLETDDRNMKKMLRFFTSSNQAKYAIRVHNEIKEHRKNFNAIAEDLQKFGLRERSITELMSKRACETYSFVDPASIIGRDQDKTNIIDLLFGFSADEKKIPTVSVVGIGGMGKTTLAQLVFHDESGLEGGLFDLKLWVSDSQKFDLKWLLMKILMCISPDDTSLHNLGQEQLQNRLIREIRGKKYLLVLDDVRNESRKNWLKLEDLLNCGSRDSRILVTTRSRKVADVIGSASTYELKGLSFVDSWQLFERMAVQGRMDEELIQIGHLIVQKCCQVPLAIKTIGCLLFKEDKSKWERVRDFDLAAIEEESNDLIPILKISYDDLDYALKQCFRYCALFPKNAAISKEMLSCIWMANGCVETNGAQSAEDVCDNNLKILYNRCFLDEVQRNKGGDVTHFRMHDLMHDLAKQVAGADMLVVDSGIMADSSKLILTGNVRHINLKGIIEIVDQISTFEPKNTKVRTLLHHDVFTWRNPWEKLLSVEKLMSDYQFLRVLDLQKWRMESLSDSIEKLVHLRYLNLSYNEFKTLPDSIVELWNLQSLLLKNCTKLEELPMGTGKLINLRHLDLEGCYALTHMPSGMGALTSLRTLYSFIVGPPESKYSARLEDLEPLSKLQGDLVIKLPNKSTLKEPGGGGALLLNKRLKTLKIEWPQSRSREKLENDMDIFAKLQPHSDLEDFTLYGYEGLMFPPWVPADDLTCVLPNLVSMMIENSSRCRHLPSFSKLVCLKRLTICNLSSLEYIEDNVPAAALFFPSLEYLWLMGLEELKGWCRSLAAGANDCEREQSSLLPPFPRLSDLHIYGCPHLKMLSMPLSSIKEFSLKSEDDDAFTLKAAEDVSGQSKDSFAPSSSFVSLSCKLHTNDGNLLLSLPWDKYLQRYLNGMPLHLVMKDFIGFDIQSTNMNEAFRRLSNRLVSLKFHENPRLRTLSEGMKHLSALRDLHIESCDGFTLLCDDTSKLMDQQQLYTVVYPQGMSDQDVRTNNSNRTIAFFTKLKNASRQNPNHKGKQQDKHNAQYTISSFRYGSLLEDKAFQDSEFPWKGLTSLVQLKLIKLQYMCRLPRGIEFVTSLQVLDCSHCVRLKELPKGIVKLINLRELNLEGCHSLTHMPCGIGALTSLCKLSRFVSHGEEFAAQLEELEPLLNLQGDLLIRLPSNWWLEDSRDSGAVLKTKSMLRTLKIEWPNRLGPSLQLGNYYVVYVENQMRSLAKLQPHYNLKEFTLCGYEGRQFPSWMPTDDLARVLPNLEHITIENTHKCHHLPSLSRLPRLTHLDISGLSSLEYIEENASAELFFPLLRCLRLTDLPKLKGWCNQQEQPLFSQSVSCRLELHVIRCPALKLTSMPISLIRRFHLRRDDSHATFTVLVKEYWWLETLRGSCYAFYTDNDHLLTSTPWEHYLKGDSGSLCVENFNVLHIPPPGMAKVLVAMSHCVTSLKIQNSPSLRTLPEELEHLTGLRELHIESCHHFTFIDEEESLEMGEFSSLDMSCQVQWKALRSLESLTLKDLPKMVRLPKWIRFVGSFHKLEICDCKNLLLPAWVRETFYHEQLNVSEEETDLFKKKY